MKKHGQNRFDVTKNHPDVDITPSVVCRKQTEAQIRDLQDTRLLQECLKRMRLAREEHVRHLCRLAAFIGWLILFGLAIASFFLHK